MIWVNFNQIISDRRESVSTKEQPNVDGVPIVHYIISWYIRAMGELFKCLTDRFI